MDRVDVAPRMLRWARERAGLDQDRLAGRFPRLNAWERGEVHPTLKQLEKYAKATYTPVGFFFLPEPPVERVPLPDFRDAFRLLGFSKVETFRKLGRSLRVGV